MSIDYGQIAWTVVPDCISFTASFGQGALVDVLAMAQGIALLIAALLRGHWEEMVGTEALLPSS